MGLATSEPRLDIVTNTGGMNGELNPVPSAGSVDVDVSVAVTVDIEREVVLHD